jgi:hypothetical protein
MICCSQPGLTEAIYICCIYIYVFLTNSNCIYHLLTIDSRRSKTVTNDRPDPPSEGAPDFKTTLTVKQYLISGHEPQMGLDTKTDWPTNRRPQRDSDRGIQRHTRPTIRLLLRVFVAVGMCLPNRCLAAIGGIHIQTRRLMGGIYEVRRWDGLSCLGLGSQKLIRGDSQTQTVCRSHKPTFVFSK